MWAGLSVGKLNSSCSSLRFQNVPLPYRRMLVSGRHTNMVGFQHITSYVSVWTGGCQVSIGAVGDTRSLPFPTGGCGICAIGRDDLPFYIGVTLDRERTPNRRPFSAGISISYLTIPSPALPQWRQPGLLGGRRVSPARRTERPGHRRVGIVRVANCGILAR